MNIPEIEQWQNHISVVYPNNLLLPIALDCLKDDDGECPSAQQLCERVAALKETAKYKNSSERVKDSSGKEAGEYEQLRHVIDQKDAAIAEKEQLRQCREERTRQIQWLSQEIQQQSHQIQQLERDKWQVEREKQQIN